MPQDFWSVLTTAGEAALTNAALTADTVDVAFLAVGSGDPDTLPDKQAALALISETWRGAPVSVAVDSGNPNWIVVETVIPANVGGWNIQEAGLIDGNGSLIALARHPSTYKPVGTQGAISDMRVRFIMAVTNAELVTLDIDPTVTIASRQYVDDAIFNNVPMATEILAGKVELATPIETQALERDDRAVTPLGLANALVADRLNEKKSDLLNDLLDAMHEGKTSVRLGAAPDPLVNLSRLHFFSSTGFNHDAPNARLNNSGHVLHTLHGSLSFTTHSYITLTADSMAGTAPNNSTFGNVWSTWPLEPPFEISFTTALTGYGAPSIFPASAVGSASSSLSVTNFVNAVGGIYLGMGDAGGEIHLTPYEASNGSLPVIDTNISVGAAHSRVFTLALDEAGQVTLRIDGTLVYTSVVTIPGDALIAFHCYDHQPEDIRNVSIVQTFGPELMRFNTQPIAINTPPTKGYMLAIGGPAPGAPDPDYAAGEVSAGIRSDDAAPYTPIIFEKLGVTETGRHVLFGHCDLPGVGTSVSGQLNVIEGLYFEFDAYVPDAE